MRVLMVAMLIALAFAGCTTENSADGQSANGAGAVTYNGASPGKQSSPTKDCDRSGDIGGTWNLGGGSANFQVKDGAGTTIWERTVSGPGQGTFSDDLSGAAGAWKIVVTRESGSMFTGGGWSGQYAAAIDC